MALITNLVSYWKLDEASGNRADSHGSNTLTDVNTVASATGKINSGADFEKNNSERLTITDGAQSGLDITGDMSFSLWLNVESFADDTLLISKWHHNTDISYMLNIGVTDLSMYVDATGSGFGYTATSKAHGMSTGTWYHVVMVYTASAGKIEFFVNGSSIGSSTGMDTSIANSSALFALGSRSNNDGFYDGIMDEVGVWSKALTSGEVTSLYNGGSGLAYPFGVDVSVSASVVSATFSIPTRTVSTAVTVSQGTPPSATFSIPAYTVSTSVSVAPNALSATFSIPSYSVITPDAQVSPSALSATFSIPSPTVSATQFVTVSPSPVSATFSIPALTVSTSVSISASVLSATFSIPAYTVTATQSVTVSPSTLSATFSIPANVVATDVSLSVSVLSATFSIPAITVTTTRSVTVSPATLSAVFYIPSFSATGDFWEEKYPATSTSWSDKAYNGSSNWSDKY